MTSVKPTAGSGGTTAPITGPTHAATATIQNAEVADPDEEGSLIHLADHQPTTTSEASSPTSPTDAPSKPIRNAFASSRSPTIPSKSPFGTNPVDEATHSRSTSQKQSPSKGGFFSFGKSKPSQPKPSTPSQSAVIPLHTSTTPSTSSHIIAKPNSVDKNDSPAENPIVVDTTVDGRDVDGSATNLEDGEGRPVAKAGTDLVSERFVESVGGSVRGSSKAVEGKGFKEVPHPFEVGDE
ncbi:hypothetical protein HK097_008929 [Rhizophlyctis rosea]|uniref:Uncharacterized protein n=1 Tax=Rhizophlyctis rosea TaxID=64517 RepID=A0AAD5S9S5_9FUNG|nr:hypothetical protein HK097_008929 [Rhizophlyctis rosea]